VVEPFRVFRHVGFFCSGLQGGQHPSTGGLYGDVSISRQGSGLAWTGLLDLFDLELDQALCTKVGLRKPEALLARPKAHPPRMLARRLASPPSLPGSPGWL